MMMMKAHNNLHLQHHQGRFCVEILVHGISGTNDQIILNDKSIAWMLHNVSMRSGVVNDPHEAK